MPTIGISTEPIRRRFNYTNAGANVGIVLGPAVPGQSEGTVRFRITAYTPGRGFDVKTQNGTVSTIAYPILAGLLREKWLRVI